MFVTIAQKLVAKIVKICGNKRNNKKNNKNNKKMKKYIYIFSIATLLVVSLVIGCKKDTESDTITDNGTGNSAKYSTAVALEILYGQLLQPNFGNIKLVNGDILKFESAEHYEQVYESLNNLYEAWTTLFIQTYDTGDEDALDAKIEQLKFDDNLPLLRFAEKYKTKLLINDIALMEEAWLNEGGSAKSPSNPITNCPIEQTLLSIYYEFCIGDTICQLRPEGYQILIPTSTLGSLSYIRNVSVEELLSHVNKGLPNYDDPPKWPVHIPTYNVTIHSTESSTCYESKHQINPLQYNGDNYRFEWSYHFRHQPFWGVTKTTATIKNYKFKNNKWKKDYGSSCRISFETKLYAEYGEYCHDRGWVAGKQSLNMKLHSRSISYPASSWLADTPKSIRDDINDSFVECRHRGEKFEFYANGNPK